MSHPSSSIPFSSPFLLQGGGAGKQQGFIYSKSCTVHCLIHASNFPSFLAQPPYDPITGLKVIELPTDTTVGNLLENLFKEQQEKKTVTAGTDVEEEKNERKNIYTHLRVQEK